jgi:hypothetical protein
VQYENPPQPEPDDSIEETLESSPRIIPDIDVYKGIDGIILQCLHKCQRAADQTELVIEMRKLSKLSKALPFLRIIYIPLIRICQDHNPKILMSFFGLEEYTIKSDTTHDPPENNSLSFTTQALKPLLLLRNEYFRLYKFLFLIRMSDNIHITKLRNAMKDDLL